MVSIENYKNILKLEFNFEEGKINHIYGVSGSGKTSIIETLMNNNFVDLQATYGKKASDIIVRKISTVNLDNIRIFNNGSVNNLLLNKNEKNMFEIIFDERGEIDPIRNEIENDISDLKDKLIPLSVEINEWENNKTKLFKFSKDGLAKNSPISKVRETLDNDKVIVENGDQILWIQNGKSYQEDEICPYCKQPISSDRIKFINYLNSLDASSFKKVYEEGKKCFEKVGIAPNDAVQDTENLLLKCNEYDLKISYFKSILGTIRAIDYNNIESLKILDINANYLKEYPELANLIDAYNQKLKELKTKLGNMKVLMDKTISKKKKVINEYLIKLGVNYEFKIDFNLLKYSEEVCPYKLAPLNTEIDEIDNNINLSEGEKNLISLLLFILKSDDSTIIFDDPISSVDEQRRKQIADIIYKECKGKTTFILSHDQVFAKIILSEESFEVDTGCVMYISNNGEGVVSQHILTVNDFDTLRNYALRRLHENSGYFQNIVALRIVLEHDKKIEENKEEYNLLYSYVSGLLHFVGESIGKTEKYNEFLISNDISEEEILEKVYSCYNVSLNKFDEKFAESIDFNNLQEIEKIYYVREITKDGNLKCELSSYIHLTDSQVLTLNPYRYNILIPAYRKKVDSYINEKCILEKQAV